MVRTIDKAIEELRKKDPDTPVTAYTLRRWIKSGVIPSVKSGNKYLVNMEILENYLKGNTEHEMQSE